MILNLIYKFIIKKKYGFVKPGLTLPERIKLYVGDMGGDQKWART